MIRIKKYLLILIGASILSFGICHVHHYCHITEGGELGLELLFKHFFNWSPSITAPIMDIICYSIGWFILGNGFMKDALISTALYSITYHYWEMLPPCFPDLINHPLLSAIVGALFVGIGVGLVIKAGGACTADDALALIICKKLHIPIGFCYLGTDITILLLSLSYIPLVNICYSLLSVNLSSAIIGYIQKTTQIE